MTDLFKKISLIMFSTILLCYVSSCSNSKNEQDKVKAVNEIKDIAEKINGDFLKIREKVKELAEQTASMYRKELIEENLKNVNREKYKLHDNGVFYKMQDDGNSAVFVSGVVPVDQTIKDIVYFTEPLDPLLKQISADFPEIAQSYYNDKYSYNRIYPFFNVLIQYEPKMDIPTFNFYYLADEKHNPEKKAVWVDEPYVDPAGRGWMVSAIAPVYADSKLEGVCGIDVTIKEITDRYIPEREKNLLIVDSKGNIVSIHEQLCTLLSLPPLTNHRYIDTIQMDTYRAIDYNLLHHKLKPVRKMADNLIQQGDDEHLLKLGDKPYTVLAATIPELDWRIIKILE